MDVIGNNIANVNTTGYKASRVIFQDIFSQTVKTGSAGMGPGEGIGGTNAIQIGLGIRLSTIDVLHSPAPFARTDNPTDMTINGDGYFIVAYPLARDPDADVDDDNPPPDFGYYYTRAGNFRIDDLGYLVTSDGFYVMGYEVRNVAEEGDPPYYRPVSMTLEPINIDDQDVQFTVDDNGMISVIREGERETIFQLGIGMFSNPSGLEKAGNSLYRQSSSSGIVNLSFGNDVLFGTGSISGGGLEMSNVDLATEFTDMIVTQRGFQANSRIITVSDSMLEELVNLKR